MLLEMLEANRPDMSFRVLLREGDRRRDAVLDECRERIAGFLALALVLAVPLYGVISGSDFSLVETSEAAETTTSIKGFSPPLVNPATALSRLETNQLSPSDIRAIQTDLKLKGFDPGPVDGVAGKRTLTALNAYRQSIRLRPVQAVSRETVAALQGQ